MSAPRDYYTVTLSAQEMRLVTLGLLKAEQSMHERAAEYAVQGAEWPQVRDFLDAAETARALRARLPKK